MRNFLLGAAALGFAFLHLTCKSLKNTQTGFHKIVWQDEFDTNGLPDPKKWDYDLGGEGWGNNELQQYTNRLQNARVENGRLIIECRKEKYAGREYTSARLVTRGKFEWTYGRIEVRAKLPTGLGTWPAIWTLGAKSIYGNGEYWPHNGEIDIMEHVGYDPDVVHSSVHTHAFNHIIGTQRTAKITVNGARDDFHTYAMEWNQDSIFSFVDARRFFAFGNDQKGWEHWPFDQAQYLLLNVAFGGNWGAAKGIDPNVLPQKMEVDWVRFYK